MDSQTKEWPMPLFPEAYQGVAYQNKSIEGRVPDFTKPEKDYRPMKVGDVVKFYAVNPANFSQIKELPEIRFQVSFVHRYGSVIAMLETEGIEKLLPGVTSLEEGKQIYLGFPGYPERVEKYGIYAIGLGKKISE
jgi:ASC-1-like (ASCH) protein